MNKEKKEQTIAVVSGARGPETRDSGAFARLDDLICLAIGRIACACIRA